MVVLISIKQAKKVDSMFAELMPNTQRVYKKSIQEFYDYYEIDIYHIRQIKKEHIVLYKEYLVNQGLNASTVNNKMDGVKYLFRKLKMVVNGFRSPFDSIENLRLKKQRVKKIVLDKDQAKELLKYLQANKNYKIYLLCKIILYTGLRITELLNLKKENIIDKGNDSYLRFYGKGQKQRLVEITRNMLITLKEYIKEQNIKNDEKLFTYERSYITNLIGKTCKHLFFLSGIGAHSLRHTFATMYYKKHPDKLQQLSDILGHSSPEYTRKIYIHLVAPVCKSEIESLYD